MRIEREAYAVGEEEWSAEAFARRMEVEEEPGFGSGGLPSAVASGSGGGGLPSAVEPDETRFRVVGPLGADVMVAERELPVAHRIIHMLRCPVSEFPQERPPDIQPDCFEQLILAGKQIHMQESRKFFVAPEDLTTGVPLVHQIGAAPLTPSFAQPLPMTPPVQRPLWTDADKEMAQTITAEQWEASAASVRAGDSGGGLPSAGPASEDLFLAPQTVVAEQAPLISPVQSVWSSLVHTPMFGCKTPLTGLFTSERWLCIPQARSGPSVTPAVEA